MALTKQDVLDTLNSYFVTQMDFWLDKVHVCARSYDDVRVLIEDGDIAVVEGADPTVAFYKADIDTLITQNVPSPPAIGSRSLLLHECTHAIVDVQKLSVTQLTNETAAYLAQTTYKLLADPNYVVPPNNPPWFAFHNHAVDLVKKFKLHRPEGRGTILPVNDYSALREEMHGLNIYQSLNVSTMAYANGVPVAVHGRFDSPPTSFQQTSHLPYPEASDDGIIELLRLRYAANDVSGFGGRIDTLRKMFNHMERIRAKTVLARLQMRKANDEMSVLFHDHLSTASRSELLGILRLR